MDVKGTFCVGMDCIQLTEDGIQQLIIVKK
jgi:hypothetical protein